MKKISVISLILILILFTAIIKNSATRIDDEIFMIKENIRVLDKDLENIKLEYDYLSSAERLIDFQENFFKDDLIKQDIQQIKIINQNLKKLEIKSLKIINE